MTNFIKNNYRSIIILVLLLLAILHSCQRSKEQEQELQAANNYKKALFAEMKTYRDTNGIIYSEKSTLQVTLAQLEQDKALLTADKKKLLAMIQSGGHKKNVIAAGLVKTEVKIGGISVKTPTVATDSTVSFTSSSDSISFAVTVKNVAPLANRTPSLTLDSLRLKNELYIEYKWGTKKEGYPVSLSVTNSNPLFKTSNIESYIIPEIAKTTVRPTFFQKLGKGVQSHGVYFGVGLGIGAVGTAILLNR